jgi:SAM-dependent methyltransferase
MSALMQSENLWGYAKRLRFIRQAVADAFPTRDVSTLKVLDVGCGNGSQVALPLIREGFQVTGVDTDERSIEHAKQLACEAFHARFICGRVEEIASAELFDVVIVSEVLEHLNEPRELLNASVERMTTEGVLIVTVPNGYGEFEIDWWIFRKLHLQRLVDRIARNQTEVVSSTDNHESGHVQFFTRRRLRRIFTECGLSLFKEGAGSFLCGPLVGHALARSSRLIEWNARVTDRLPLGLASAWYFALRRRSEERAVNHAV